MDLSYGLALPDVIQPGWRRAAMTHLMNDESVVLALAQSDLTRKRAAYWLSGIGVLICWAGGALAGALLGTEVRNVDALGLDAIFPTVILALILPALRDRATLKVALAGAAIALATTPFLPPGLPLLLALAGLACYARRRETT